MQYVQFISLSFLTGSNGQSSDSDYDLIIFKSNVYQCDNMLLILWELNDKPLFKRNAHLNVVLLNVL